MLQRGRVAHDVSVVSKSFTKQMPHFYAIVSAAEGRINADEYSAVLVQLMVEHLSLKYKPVAL